MKTYLLILAFIGASCASEAQKIKSTDVPKPVTEAFQKKYPDADKVKWTKEEANFEAGFESEEKEMSVLMDAQGMILETETDIESSKLPAAVMEYVKKNHAGAKIAETSMIINAQNKVTYEVEINGKDLIFDDQGNFIK